MRIKLNLVLVFSKSFTINQDGNGVCVRYLEELNLVLRHLLLECCPHENVVRLLADSITLI
jgi:hypothetical protein